MKLTDPVGVALPAVCRTVALNSTGAPAAAGVGDTILVHAKEAIAVVGP